MPKQHEHAHTGAGVAGPREAVSGPPEHRLLMLQRAAGNAAVTALVRLDQQRAAAVQPAVQRLVANGTLYVQGDKDTFLDPADQKVYVKAYGSTGTLWKMKEVLAGASPTLSATTRDYVPATASWLAAGAAPPKAAAPLGWSAAQLRAAGLVSKAANHYQLDAPDYNGFHVHVSAYTSGSLADSIHVKFDTRGDDYLSFFYRFDGTQHGGQRKALQVATIAAFTGCSVKVAEDRWVDVQAQSDAVANGVLARLGT
ncbi:MAG: hypothetical protein JWM64_59 [Frankiales bacterium]|nr:hypothetical protein [Frankiales bacterium]